MYWPVRLVIKNQRSRGKQNEAFLSLVSNELLPIMYSYRVGQLALINTPFFSRLNALFGDKQT